MVDERRDLSWNTHSCLYLLPALYEKLAIIFSYLHSLPFFSGKKWKRDLSVKRERGKRDFWERGYIWNKWHPTENRSTWNIEIHCFCSSYKTTLWVFSLPYSSYFFFFPKSRHSDNAITHLLLHSMMMMVKMMMMTVRENVSNECFFQKKCITEKSLKEQMINCCSHENCLLFKVTTTITTVAEISLQGEKLSSNVKIVPGSYSRDHYW